MTEEGHNVKTEDQREAIDFTRFRPFAWVLMLSLALWAIYFITLPKWAVATVAVLLGILSSFVLGIEIKTFWKRTIRRRNTEIQTAFQKEVDEIDRRFNDAS